MNDADCQKDEYKDTVVCYFGGVDPSDRSCAVQCNDQLASEVPGKICRDECGGKYRVTKVMPRQKLLPYFHITSITTSILRRTLRRFLAHL